ncbi:MAG: MATE family efflux transporter [Bacteroidales bacterium]|nr:MATE family efflux transporter [Bacteroidales bacterium]
MKLHKEILRLAVPSILANITVPLVGMVDIAVAGHLAADFSSAALIGGISVGTMLFDLLYWNFAFLRAGTGGLTAQAYGKATSVIPSDLSVIPSEVSVIPSEVEESPLGAILLRALRIALLSGLALILVQWLVVQGAFLVVKCSPEVRDLASQYFYIRIWAAPATLSLFAFKGWFIGMQDSVRPMTADILVNFLNIVLSIVLATLTPLGFRGIAIGTVIAQWSGFLYCTAAVLRRYRQCFPPHGRIIGRFSGGDGFFRMNRDLFLRSVGMIAVYIGFTVISARYGDLMLAVSTILMKLLMIFSYFTDGFAYAGEALTGRFIGEKSRDGVRSTVRQTFLWGLGVTALFMLVYGLGGRALFGLMTSDQAVIDAGRQFIPWLLLMPLIGCPAFIWDGIYIGATASRDLRNSTLLCAVGFFAVWFIGIALAGSTASGTTGSATPETAIHILMAAYFMHLAIRTGYLSLRSWSLPFFGGFRQ